MFFGPPASSTSTPQKTLQAFVTALNRRDRRAMESFISNRKNNPALGAFLKNEGEMPPALMVQDITLRKLTASRVRVQYLLGAKSANVQGEKPVREYVEMVKVGDRWLIEAPKFDMEKEPGVLADYAIIVADPEVLKLLNQKAKFDQAESNLNQVARAAIHHADTHDHKFTFTAENYVKELSAYNREEGIFTSPLDPPGTISFSFNTNLIGKDRMAIKDRDRRTTILFFEGKPGRLNFRYDGKALVAFADARVLFVTPAEAKKLLWK